MNKHLTAPCQIDDYNDLRHTRQTSNNTHTADAQHYHVRPHQALADRTPNRPTSHTTTTKSKKQRGADKSHGSPGAAVFKL